MYSETPLWLKLNLFQQSDIDYSLYIRKRTVLEVSVDNSVMLVSAGSGTFVS